MHLAEVGVAARDAPVDPGLPQLGQALVQILGARAEGVIDLNRRFALYFEDATGATACFSFWDIQMRANRLSNALRGLGVGVGDRVAIVLPQRPETAISYMAIFQMGAIAVPLSHLFGPDALEYRLRDAGVAIAIVDPETLPNLWAARDRLPQLDYIVGTAGARETRVLDWDVLLEKSSRCLTRWIPLPMILHRSSTTSTTGTLRGVDTASRPSR